MQVALQQPDGGATRRPRRCRARPRRRPRRPPISPPGRARDPATIEQTYAAENLARQQLTNDVEQRLKTARDLMDQGQPEAAITPAPRRRTWSAPRRMSLNPIAGASTAASRPR